MMPYSTQFKHGLCTSMQGCTGMLLSIIRMIKIGSSSACNYQCWLRQVRIIVSGVGDYRYVDCVAIRAGKQEALEYVRALFNIPLSRCMAAGDSGNDTLMLEGMETGPAFASLLVNRAPAIPRGSRKLPDKS